MKKIIKLSTLYGFTHVQLGKTYEPLKLECIATQLTRGENYKGIKMFEEGSRYKLYCMYGRDTFNERHLYCNDKPHSSAHKIFKGGFLFVFNANEFFQLLQNASKQNWLCFAYNTILEDKKELAKFEDLLNNDTSLTHKQKCRAADLISRLKITKP